MIQQFYSTLVTSVSATGRIKKYETTVSALMLTIIPIAYVVLRMGGMPYMVFVVYLVVVVIAYLTILYIALPMIQLSLIDYLVHAVKPCMIVFVLSLIVPVSMKLLVPPGLVTSLLNCTLTVISTAVLSYVFGLDLEVKEMISKKIRKIVGKVAK
jgi:hypothetical protein